MRIIFLLHVYKKITARIVIILLIIATLNTKEFMFSNCGVGEDSWESLGLQEIKPVNPKGNQPWILIGRTYAEAEAPIFWSPDAKSLLIRKHPDAGKEWRQEKGMTEDEVAGCITDSMDMSLSKLWEMVKDRKASKVASIGSQRVGHNWATEQQLLGRGVWGGGKEERRYFFKLHKRYKINNQHIFLQSRTKLKNIIYDGNLV